MLIATILATSIYLSEAKQVEPAFSGNGLSVKLSVGPRTYALVWVGTVLTAAAAIGWTWTGAETLRKGNGGDFNVIKRVLIQFPS